MCVSVSVSVSYLKRRGRITNQYVDCGIDSLDSPKYIPNISLLPKSLFLALFFIQTHIQAHFYSLATVTNLSMWHAWIYWMLMCLWEYTGPSNGGTQTHRNGSETGASVQHSMPMFMFTNLKWWLHYWWERTSSHSVSFQKGITPYHLILSTLCAFIFIFIYNITHFQFVNLLIRA